MSDESEEEPEVSGEGSPINIDGTPAPTKEAEPSPPHMPSIGFQQAIQLGFKNYFNFRGRATRSEFWYWGMFTGVLEGIGEAATTSPELKGWVSLTVVNFLLALIFIIPSFSVLVRRLHDTNRSVFWYLGIVGLCALVALGNFLGIQPVIDGSPAILIIAALAMLSMLAAEGTPGENDYGPPRGETL